MAFVILSSVILRETTHFQKANCPFVPLSPLCPRESGTDKLGASRKERGRLLTRNRLFVGMQISEAPLEKTQIKFVYLLAYSYLCARN